MVCPFYSLVKVDLRALWPLLRAVVVIRAVSESSDCFHMCFAMLWALQPANAGVGQTVSHSMFLLLVRVRQSEGRPAGQPAKPHQLTEFQVRKGSPTRNVGSGYEKTHTWPQLNKCDLKAYRVSQRHYCY